MLFKRKAAHDMTQGAIVKQLIRFALPLMLGNIFQMLYNTVDTIVVGNFVGTRALAAVGSTTMLINTLVFFANGFAIGAGVVISRYFGAKEYPELHRTIETTMAMTMVLAVLLTMIGVVGAEPMLRAISTPDDVMGDAAIYLKIYFGGISGLLIYNMGGGILRAVGDTLHPLYFLILTSVLNVVLDLLFVLGFHGGVAGVACATVISQLISAGSILYILSRTDEVFKLTWADLRADMRILKEIVRIGLPTAFQAALSGISNVMLQGYINVFGAGCMAGWSTYSKLDQLIYMPLHSIGEAATTFVGQNVGAKNRKRVNEGTWKAVALAAGVTAVLSALEIIFARPMASMISKDPQVLDFAVLFLTMNTRLLVLNGINQTLAGAIRGRGDAKGPMAILLGTFFGVRQAYLFLATRLIGNTPAVVGFGYPAGWISCIIIMTGYYYFKYGRKSEQAVTA